MKVTWLGQSERLELHGYVIDAPMTYCSEGDPYEAESSCIIKWLEVGAPRAEEKGALGYWPSYARMEPHQRANYLAWSADGRKVVLNDVGYPFVFFYGLERRAIVDSSDHGVIINEVLQLLSDYQHSNSFRGYSVSFIACLLALNDCDFEFATPATLDLLVKFLSVQPELCAVMLAAYAKATKPIPVQIIQPIVDADNRSTQSVVTQRLRSQFEELFAHRYRERYGEGLVPALSQQRIEISYRPASGSLLNKQSLIKPASIPNIASANAEHFSKLVSLWNDCVQDLKPLNRVVGSGADITSRAAYEELPPELRANIEHPDKSKWTALVTQHLRPDGSALVEVASIAAMMSIAERERLTPTQSEDLATTATETGFAIEPDARIDGSTYLWQDLVVIFKPRHEGVSTTRNYRAAAMMLELGSWIAFADGKIDNAELDAMVSSIKTLVDLDEDDSYRLQMLKEVLVANPREPRRLAARIRDSLPLDQRVKVGEYLVGIAMANGVVGIRERRTLRRAYASLGIDTGLLLNLLPADDDEELTVVRKGSQISGGETIPYAKPTTPVFVVDQAKLRAVFDNTEEVSAILSQAFTSSDTHHAQVTVNIPCESSTLPTTPVQKWKGLPAKYDPVMSEILKKREWTRHDFDSLTREHGLMAPAVITDINNWSDEHLGDLLLDEQGDIFVNSSLLDGKS